MKQRKQRITWALVVALATSKGLLAEKRGKKYFVWKPGVEAEFATVAEAYSDVYHDNI
jgi:hypothetical protein